MMRRALPAALAAVMLLASSPAAAGGREGDKPAPPPPTPAERIAGRWRITLDGLAEEHQEILAAFAIEGELLIGTLSVGRDMVKIARSEERRVGKECRL